MMTHADEAESRDPRSFDDAWFAANKAGRERLEAQLAAANEENERLTIENEVIKKEASYLKCHYLTARVAELEAEKKQVREQLTEIAATLECAAAMCTDNIQAKLAMLLTAATECKVRLAVAEMLLNHVWDVQVTYQDYDILTDKALGTGGRYFTLRRFRRHSNDQIESLPDDCKFASHVDAVLHAIAIGWLPGPPQPTTERGE